MEIQRKKKIKKKKKKQQNDITNFNQILKSEIANTDFVYVKTTSELEVWS